MKTLNEFLDELYTLLEVNLNTSDFVSGMKKEGWTLKRQKGGHDVYSHPHYSGISVIPRSRKLSRGVHHQETQKRMIAMKNQEEHEREARRSPR